MITCLMLQQQATFFTVEVTKRAKRKRAINGATLIAQGGHVNFTRFSVHLHFSKRIGGLQVWKNLTI